MIIIEFDNDKTYSFHADEYVLIFDIVTFFNSKTKEILEVEINNKNCFITEQGSKISYNIQLYLGKMI